MSKAFRERLSFLPFRNASHLVFFHFPFFFFLWSESEYLGVIVLREGKGERERGGVEERKRERRRII